VLVGQEIGRDSQFKGHMGREEHMLMLIIIVIVIVIVIVITMNIMTMTITIIAGWVCGAQ